MKSLAWLIGVIYFISAGLVWALIERTSFSIMIMDAFFLSALVCAIAFNITGFSKQSDGILVELIEPTKYGTIAHKLFLKNGNPAKISSVELWWQGKELIQFYESPYIHENMIQKKTRLEKEIAELSTTKHEEQK